MTIQTYNQRVSCEQSLLAVLCMDVEKLRTTEIKPELFSIKIHQNIYRALKESIVDGRIEPMELMKYLVESEIDYYLKLTDSYVSSSNFEYLLSEVENQYKNRCTAAYLKKLNNEELDFDEFSKKIQLLNEMTSVEGVEIKRSVQEIKEEMMSQEEVLKFIKFSEFETKIRLLKRTVNVIAARPSVGKTALALNMMDDLSNHYHCVYLNLENAEKVIMQRIVGIESHLEIDSFPKAAYDNDINDRLEKGIESMLKKNFVLKNGSQTLTSIRKIVSRESRKQHCILFVDHVGYVIGSPKKNDHDRVTECMKEFNTLTKDYDCTIIVLAHINREGTDDPKLEHLKDSGELEQTGHAVMILNYDQGSTDTEKIPTMKLFVGKNRSGRRGNVYFRYDKTTQAFYEGKRR